MKVCLGGTFSPFHVGHEALLQRAADTGDHIFVGITHQDLASRPDRDVPPWQERAEAVTEFLTGLGVDFVVNPLTKPEGPAATGDYDAIVVSPETVPGAARINDARRRAGLKPLDVVVAPHVLGEDLLPISSTAIHAGLIDRSGKRLQPLAVRVGSMNQVKIDAVRSVMQRLIRAELDVQGVDVHSSVPEQPRSHETMQGARNRAQAAMAGVDYAVGIEAGLNQDPEERAWYDVQACVVVDRNGHETDGWGPAFQHPEWVTKRALAGEMISDILGPVAGDPRIGSTTGAIGWLTDGAMDRTQLTEIAVLMAMVPRIRREAYAATC